jgi:hypothetical protein
MGKKAMSMKRGIMKNGGGTGTDKNEEWRIEGRNSCLSLSMSTISVCM